MEARRIQEIYLPSNRDIVAQWQLAMKSAGLIFDHSAHYVDHLAPFCALQGWPLFVCEPDIAEACRRFYPGLEVRELAIHELRRELPACIVACQPKAFLKNALGDFLPSALRTLWLPHGHSDKGWHTPFFEALKEEELLFVYGQRMRETLRAKGVDLPQCVVGNFRQHYYEANRPFYDALVRQQVGLKRFVLYAPTWDESNTFWLGFSRLSSSVPSNRRLLIKVHPNTELAFPAELERCKGEIAKRPNVSFLEGFPCIYPLLARADAYIGDMSSIGYDFLRFDKPLFFLNAGPKCSLEDKSAFLMRCGEQISIDDIGSIWPKLTQDRFQSERRATLKQVFHSLPSGGRTNTDARSAILPAAGDAESV